MVELTEVARQQGDDSFIKLLNTVQEGGLDEDANKALLLRFVAKGISNYPQQAIHIFAENNPVGQDNETTLEYTDQSLVCLNAVDEVPKGCQLNESQLKSIKKRKSSDTGNLAILLKLKIEAGVII